MTADARQVAEEVPDSSRTIAPLEHSHTPWQQRDRAEMIDDLLERLGLGETLSSLCDGVQFPPLATIYRWRRSDPDLLTRFGRAREEFWESQADLAIDIIDGRAGVGSGSTERDKLRAWGRLQLLDRQDNRAEKLAKASPNKGKTLPPRIEIVGIQPRRLAAPAPVEAAPEPEPANPDGLVL